MDSGFDGGRMTSNLSRQREKPNPIPAWGRPFAVATAILFLISLLFPVVAGLSKDTASFPAWWGRLDVGIAFILAIMTFVIYGLAHGSVDRQAEVTTYRAYRILIHVIFVLVVVFLLFGDRITWVNGLPGIAWRAWLLLYILPEWLAIMVMGSGYSI
jgi:hypothetical protein